MTLLIDGNSLFARSFYAAQSKGRDFGGFCPAESVTMAMRTVLSLLNPDSNRIGYQFKRMLVAWDGAQNPHKNREPKPQEYHEMRALLEDVMTLAFCPTHAVHAEYEGDDVLATAVYNDQTTEPIYLVSGDKDLMQLQGGRVRYFDLNQKAVLSEKWITGKWHIKHPQQLAIALAIIGDPVDNIAGIPRWGPKKAAKLFENVPMEASFEQALDAITAQIPNDLQDFFWAALDRTLLKIDVPGVQAPAPIRMADPNEIEDLGLNLEGYYDQVWQTYEVEPY